MWTSLFLIVALQMGPDPPPGPLLLPPRVPIGYAPAPDGTPLRIVERPWIDGPGFRVTIRNDGARTIVGLRYVALVERWPWPFAQPAQHLEHDFGPIVLERGRTIALTTQWLNAEELDRLQSTAPDKIQIFLAPSLIRFSDGTEWTQSVDVGAGRSRESPEPSVTGSPVPAGPRRSAAPATHR